MYFGLKDNPINLYKAPNLYDQLHAGDLLLGSRNPGSSFSFTVNCSHLNVFSDSSTTNSRGNCSFVQSTDFNWAHSGCQSFCQAFKIAKAILTNSSTIVEMDTLLTASQW